MRIRLLDFRPFKCHPPLTCPLLVASCVLRHGHPVVNKPGWVLGVQSCRSGGVTALNESLHSDGGQGLGASPGELPSPGAGGGGAEPPWIFPPSPWISCTQRDVTGRGDAWWAWHLKVSEHLCQCTDHKEVTGPRGSVSSLGSQKNSAWEP